MKKIDLRKLTWYRHKQYGPSHLGIGPDRKRVASIREGEDAERVGAEIEERYNSYLDLVAEADGLACVVEDTGGSERRLAAPLRKLLEDQGWDKDSLSALLDAREEADDGSAVPDYAGIKKGPYWAGHVDGKWGVWDGFPGLKSSKLLVAATSPQDAENKRKDLEQFKLEPVATAQPFTVVVAHENNGRVAGVYQVEAENADRAGALSVDLCLIEQGENVERMLEGDEHTLFRLDSMRSYYRCIAIYAGHLTNLIQ